MPSKKLKSTICPDRYYHVYNRGNNKEKIFFIPSDYDFFLTKYKQFIVPYADTYAYCLLPNHFHFLFKTREEVPSAKSVIPNQLRKLFISHTIRINYMQRRTGSLFTKNYQRIEIDNDGYLNTLVNYIHKNPVKHGIYQDFENYPYSSFPAFIMANSSFISREEVFSWFGGKNAFIQFHKEDPLDPVEFTLMNIDEDERRDGVPVK
jgi:REP element-mobilizing transposase RayT